MNSLEIILPKSNKAAMVMVERKKMKTCRLKVYTDQSIAISVPINIPTRWIQEFLNQKSGWIEKKLERFAATEGYASTNEIRDGYSIKMFGEDLIFSVSKSDRNFIYKEAKTIRIGSTNPNDQKKLMMQFEKWWRNESAIFLEKRVSEFYPIIKKYNKELPKIQIRKMKTLWGSCSVNREVITFNLYLTKAKPACIDYVVLHELIHFIYPNHSKQFYDFLSIYMPDWKERKILLDQDVVHGL